ncbi:hypothetical protein FYJ43_03820 [Cutibacterium sp. WCA-380-WT-3A]|uniref:Secreted protein n=1 Tax=Cutibacterium porci TaxID=2605781 RepID=A0A7K0J5H3_9ACTN|nr:hypothetical protein [Cutibacterium porci]MSS45190.1 hypothetical protein [Cutibacterium porci]
MPRRISVLRRAVMGGVTAAVALTTVLSAAPAHAVDESSSTGINFELPQRWNDDYKPGTRCTPQGTRGVYVTASRRWFKQTDGASVENSTNATVPVTHTVTVKRSETTEVKAEIKAEGTLATYLNQSYGFDYVDAVSWELSQKVGPYDLAPHTQGRLVWGFVMLDVDAQNVTCGADLTWHAVGKPFSGTNPESRYAELTSEGAID